MLTLTLEVLLVIALGALALSSLIIAGAVALSIGEFIKTSLDNFLYRRFIKFWRGED